MHLLFVDDTFETRDLFRLCFTLEGHTVDTAHNGPEALRIIQQNAPQIDVIIMDQHMPQMTGLEVVQNMRRIEELNPIPVILFTGEMPGHIEKEAESLGVAKVVYKPIMPGELISLAQEVANKP